MFGKSTTHGCVYSGNPPSSYGSLLPCLSSFSCTAYFPPLFILTKQTRKQTARRTRTATTMPMNHPEEDRGPTEE